MGKIYDDAALGRVQNWVDLQEKTFTDAEKEKNTKQWFFLGAIVVITSVAILLVIKKIGK